MNTKYFTLQRWTVGRTFLALGSITSSLLYFSLEPKPWDWSRRWVSWGPTYQGTRAGLVAGLPFGTILAHWRENWRD